MRTQHCRGLPARTSLIPYGSPGGGSGGVETDCRRWRRAGNYTTCAHRALADADTTARCFERLMEPVGGWGLSLCDAIREQGGPMGLLPVNPRESLLPLELEEALEHASR